MVTKGGAFQRGGITLRKDGHKTAGGMTMKKVMTFTFTLGVRGGLRLRVFCLHLTNQFISRNRNRIRNTSGTSGSLMFVYIHHCEKNGLMVVFEPRHSIRLLWQLYSQLLAGNVEYNEVTNRMIVVPTVAIHLVKALLDI